MSAWLLPCAVPRDREPPARACRRHYGQLDAEHAAPRQLPHRRLPRGGAAAARAAQPAHARVRHPAARQAQVRLHRGLAQLPAGGRRDARGAAREPRGVRARRGARWHGRGRARRRRRRDAALPQGEHRTRTHARTHARTHSHTERCTPQPHCRKVRRTHAAPPDGASHTHTYTHLPRRATRGSTRSSSKPSRRRRGRVPRASRASSCRRIMDLRLILIIALAVALT